MRFVPNTNADVATMLERIGVPSVEALFSPIPARARLSRALDLPPGASEQEVLAELGTLAGRDASLASHRYFLGAGVYPHFIPAAVDALASRAEFTTSYTPYQPEISQGTLQAIFEWQTMICGLTGLDVANASLYDGASATAEAALMAMRLTRRPKIVISAGLHPHYRDVLGTYVGGPGGKVVSATRSQDGRTCALASLVDEETACIIVQQPAFLGVLEDLAAAEAVAREHGALLIVCVTEALSLALLRAPGDLGADVVCGEAQSFGVPMGFGGPHLGLLAARAAHVRQMPGRLVGETVDGQGRRGFVLTLSTREQHIRRERATSNICTNQGLMLLRATIYLALLGPRGLRRLAELNFAKAEYAKAQVARTPGLRLPLAAPTFNEFVVGVPDSGAAALARAQSAGIVGGLDLAPYADDLGPAVLVCTTELVSRSDIDRLLAALAGSGR
ncbi:MAG: aminomethyl-transferring glycine dehydrogenase subunit GcvPA [Deltaproteobacteria bacterium]|nr:aminomethyl-transferring glycine dehydrogenase subunit GcvPA [Deltaproteobacteria bacterium]